MNTPWLNAYEPKEWQKYEIAFPASPELKELRCSLKEPEEAELYVCGAESAAAELRWQIRNSVEGMLFYDIEQLWSMDLNTVYGVDSAGFLIKEWRGHPVGSLVMILYTGVNSEPRFVTVGVAKNPAPSNHE